MQKAEVVLKILRKKSEQSEEYVFGRLYRNLFNPDFYMLAYNRIHAKEGNMTPGADGKTIDGFNVVLVEKLIGKIRKENYYPKPVRRVYIPKKKGGVRSLGIPSFMDKLVQEVLRMLLEAIYEPIFSENGIPQRLEATRGQLSNYQNQVKAAEEELQRPFPYADKLKEKSARLAKLNAELTMSESSPSPKPDGPPNIEPIELEIEDTGISVPEAPEKTHPVPPVEEAVNFRGIPSSVSGETIRNLKLIEGDPVIYMTPRTDGQQYKGTILHVDKEQGYCVQLSGKHSLFVHSLDRLERMPEVGESLKLSYPRESGHKATLSIQETPSQTHVRSRR